MWFSKTNALLNYRVFWNIGPYFIFIFNDSIFSPETCSLSVNFFSHQGTLSLKVESQPSTGNLMRNYIEINGTPYWTVLL